MATCSFCGAQIPDNAKFCTTCGAALAVEAEPVQQPIEIPAEVIPEQPPAQPFQQPAYGQPQPDAQQTYQQQAQQSFEQPQPQQAYQQPQQPYQQPQQGQPTFAAPAEQAVVDSGSIGWGVLGFIIPIVGIILFFVWRNTKPKSGKIALYGAIISIVLAAILRIAGVS